MESKISNIMQRITGSVASFTPTLTMNHECSHDCCGWLGVDNLKIQPVKFLEMWEYLVLALILYCLAFWDHDTECFIVFFSSVFNRTRQNQIICDCLMDGRGGTIIIFHSTQTTYYPKAWSMNLPFLCLISLEASKENKIQRTIFNLE